MIGTSMCRMIMMSSCNDNCSSTFERLVLGVAWVEVNGAQRRDYKRNVSISFQLILAG